MTVASIAGRISLPTTGPYSVSKYAVEAYCDVIRLTLGLLNMIDNNMCGNLPYISYDMLPTANKSKYDIYANSDMNCAVRQNYYDRLQQA